MPTQQTKRCAKSQLQWRNLRYEVDLIVYASRYKSNLSVMLGTFFAKRCETFLQNAPKMVVPPNPHPEPGAVHLKYK